MIQQAGGAGPTLEQEYRAGREAAGLVTLARGTLDVSGPKRQDFLHAMLSNDVNGRRPGEGCRAASMSAKGSLQAFLRVLVGANVVVLETEAERLPLVQQTLEHHKVGAPVRFAARPTTVLGLVGPDAGRALQATGASPLPEGLESHGETRVGEQPVRLVRAGDLPGGGFVLHAAPEHAEAVRAALEAAGAAALGREALDALRIEALCPWYGTDVTEDNLLHETGLLAVLHSSTKGCYVGQEVIARLEGRGGNVSKALRGLRLAAASTPGTRVTADGKDVGWLTTCAVSPRLGPIAMGYVHRSHFAAGSIVEVAGAPARVVLAFDEAGDSRVKIYTKTGDEGETGLLGGGRVPKDALRVCAYGDVDEANATIGVVAAHADAPLTRLLGRIQKDLFAIGARLADPTHAVAARRAKAAVTAAHVRRLEKAIDARERELTPLRAFVLPGGRPVAALLHQARTVVRRAERTVVALSHDADVEPGIIVYLNRLSDLLFVLARHENHRAGTTETRW